MTPEAEVCVIGGGPAGATVAARLAQLGHDVVVVEQHPFPRPHVGESLSPAAWPVLDLLGVGDLVAGAGFTRTALAHVRWRGERAELVDVPGGLTVDRGRLDAILLRHAIDSGARVLEAGQARRPARRDGRWELSVGGGTSAGARRWELSVDGGTVRGGSVRGGSVRGGSVRGGSVRGGSVRGGTVCARYLVDASGRRRVLGGGRTTTGPRTLALHAMWRGGPARDGTQTRIEAIADGWLWGAWLPGGTFRAMAFVDPPALLAEGRDKARLYHRLLASSELFAELVAGDARAGPVHACDATTFAVANAIDETSLRAGEAAFAIDPLSSSGVQTAIQSGLAAAAAAHTILAPGGDPSAATEYYASMVRHAAARHAVTAASLYAEHRLHAHAPFWQRRSAGAAPPPPAPRVAGAAPPPPAPRVAGAAPPPPAPPEPRGAGAASRGQAAATALADLLALPARLPDDATLRPTPVLVADRVEWRPALDHPALDRPVAFLGGDEIAPLVNVLHRSPTLADAIRRWDEILPPGSATAIAGWLHERGLLVADRVAAPA